MIYLLFPTVRPSVFKSTHLDWMNKCTDPNNITTKVVVSSEEHKTQLDEYDTIIDNSNKEGVCYSSYCLTKDLELNDTDIIILASDDFFPPDKWDEYLINKFIDFNGCLFVADGYQNTQVKDGELSITIPIMTFDCLKQLNKAIYHPSYLHFFADTELFKNVKALNLLKDNRDIDNVIFEHRHHVVRKRNEDEYDLRNNNKWGHDSANYFNRMQLPISERIKIEV